MMDDGRQRVPWGIRDMIVASVAALVLFGVGLGLFFGVAWAATAAGSAPLPSYVQAVAILSLEALLIPPVWVWGPRLGGRGWDALGLRPSPLWASAILVFVSLVLVMIINAGWEIARQELNWTGQPEILPIFGGGLVGYLLALLGGGVVAPLAEELFFRGYLYAGLRDRWGVGWAMIVSAAIFSAVHVYPGVLPPIFLMGLIFAWLYQRFGSLWPCVALHALVNSMAFTLAYVQELFPELLQGLG